MTFLKCDTIPSSREIFFDFVELVFVVKRHKRHVIVGGVFDIGSVFAGVGKHDAVGVHSE